LGVLKRIAEINGCPKDTVTNNMILQVDNPLLNRKLIKKLKNKQRMQYNVNRQRLLNNGYDDNVSIQNSQQIPTRRGSTAIGSHKSKTNSFESINLGSSKNNNTGNGNGYHSNRSSEALSSLSPMDDDDTTTITTMNNTYNNGLNNNEAFNNINVNIDLDLEAHQMTWSDIISELFSNKTHGRNLRRATPIIWMAWFGSSFGLSSFGVFLPKFMSSKNIHISSVYGDALILAIASFPGPFIGAYLVETHRFGRRYTMTISGFCISLCILLFIFLENEIGLVSLACLISLLTQVWYAGLMCFTPEAYPTDIRTTASGLATAIRHVANILGPIITGKTFGESGHTPLLMSALAVLCACCATYFLPFDTRKKRLVPTVRVSL